MFSAIPAEYDRINRFITLGMDRGWRIRAARECLKGRPTKFLDLCCGTGDLALTVAGMADYELEIRGLDYSQPMLDIAAGKAADAAKKSGTRTKNIAFSRGEVSKLPFSNDYFDCVGISFAFRNLTYQNPLRDRHIAEILRVLKPGGKCVIVESSQPGPRLIRSLYHCYMRQYVYRTGALLSGNKAAYRYLAESACRFYSPEELEKLLLGSGFTGFSSRLLFFGAAAVYTAVK